jgi:hypothetical protein
VKRVIDSINNFVQVTHEVMASNSEIAPEKSGSTELAGKSTNMSSQSASQIIFQSNEVTNTFSVNPLDSNIIAIGTSHGITEIDVNQCLSYLKVSLILIQQM